MFTKLERYREHARAMRNMANEAMTEALRDTYLRLEVGWLTKAQEAEQELKLRAPQ